MQQENGNREVSESRDGENKGKRKSRAMTDQLGAEKRGEGATSDKRKTQTRGARHGVPVEMARQRRAPAAQLVAGRGGVLFTIRFCGDFRDVRATAMRRAGPKRGRWNSEELAKSKGDPSSSKRKTKIRNKDAEKPGVGVIADTGHFPMAAVIEDDDGDIRGVKTDSSPSRALLSAFRAEEGGRWLTD